jgi:hypothetical protein
VSQRWEPICSDCWYLIVGQNDYYPMHTGFDTCASCGEDALIVNVHPEIVREARDELHARDVRSREQAPA